MAEEYTEELAIAHIRRLLDIVACTTFFGSPSSSSPKPAPRPQPKEPGPADGEASDNAGDQPTPKPADKKPGPGLHVAPDANDKADVSMCPPPRLGEFYDFFSFSHLTPPLHCELLSLSLTHVCVLTVCGNDSMSSV